MASRLFVDGFPSFFGEQDLQSLFLPYGTVLHAEIVRSPSGGSLRFGFVEMATCQEACRAVTELNRHRIRDSKLMVLLAEDTGQGSIVGRVAKRQMA
jgi:RNA recognition motif-containing protein